MRSKIDGSSIYHLRQQRSQHQYADFIARACEYGLPVKSLIGVALFALIDTGGRGDEYRPFWGVLVLQPSITAEVKNMAPTLPVGESKAIQTLYHESTHAHIDLHRDEAPFRELMARGERHYSGAKELEWSHD
jgi:hypothetical protein